MSTRCFLPLAVAVVLLAVVHYADSCASSGVCGGVSGCYQPPPPPPVCGCAPSQSCGRYGCYTRRSRVAAASVRTKEIGGKKRRGPVSRQGSNEIAAFSGEKRFSSPDARFMQCCEERNLPDVCMDKCTFKTYTKDALMRMYFKQDPCPIEATAEMQFCAAQGQDHRECCVRNGVGSTTAGAKCLVFCNQTPGFIQQLDMSYLACYDRFENMKGCFFHEMQLRK
uniref:Domain of unknown function DB domain-containing protein n=1 Tax=Plectus sambesii TaxID=2011161 RepID=A0A914VTM6_9BILA